jgi:hypothetical protein
MPKAARSASPGSYQLKVTLAGIEPSIWRRVQVPGDTTLESLNRVIQTAMGWSGDHLHRFLVGGVEYGLRESEQGDIWDKDTRDEAAAKLSEVAPSEKDNFEYEYDFGDCWMHEVVVEKMLAGKKGDPAIQCLAGARACPPEDCGGPWGYEQTIAALRDSKHPDHQEMLELIGGDFDPEAFDVDAVNEALSKLV